MQPGFRAWAIGDAARRFDPISAFFALAVCDACKPKVKLGDMLPQLTIARINRALELRHKKPLDPTSAELVFFPVQSDRLNLGPFSRH